MAVGGGRVGEVGESEGVGLLLDGAGVALWGGRGCSRKGMGLQIEK